MLPGVELLQFSQSFVQRDKFVGPLFRYLQRIVKWNALQISAMLEIPPPARVIDEDVPHHLCRRGKKVIVILPVGFFLLRQSEVRFIHERSCLQRVPLGLSLSVSMSDPAQLAVNQRSEPGERRRIAFPPTLEQLC